MSSVKIEFLVQMTCDSCVEAVKKSLKNEEGIKNVDINLAKGSVVIESTLPILQIQERLESTGRKVAIKGFDGTIAAVSIVDNGDKNVQGVVRFVQVTPEICIIDGTIDGLQSGIHSIAIHECGDISHGWEGLGKVFNLENDKGRVYGELGQIMAEKNGRAVFRFEDHVIILEHIIGRSFVVKKEHDSVEMPISWGIVARSAGLFQNPKTICACDGISIWDEVSKPKNKSNL